jgi:hypothetical protein
MIEVSYQPYWANSHIIYSRELQERGFANPYDIWMMDNYRAKEAYWTSQNDMRGRLCWLFENEEDAIMFVLKLS